MTDDAVDTTPEHTPVLAPPANPDLRWYVVHAYSGMEKAVERNITERINRAGMQDKFGRILVPTEEVVEIKNGQKRTTERRFFPGYVLVEMIMDDESWHLVKHTNKVTGFVGGAKNRRSVVRFWPLRTSTTSSVGTRMRPNLPCMPARLMRSVMLRSTAFSMPE